MTSLAERVQRHTRATQSEAIRLGMIIRSTSQTFPFDEQTVFDTVTRMANQFQAFGPRKETPELDLALVTSVLRLALTSHLEPGMIGLQVATMMITATVEQAEGD